MNPSIKYSSLLLFGFFISNSLFSQTWSDHQQDVISSIKRLSASTAPNGGGADAYGEMLTDDFTRWTVGSSIINNKTDWVEDMREWFDAGWRVTDREVEFVEIAVNNGAAFTRRNVTETYLGPDGETSTSKAAVAETWLKINGTWMLFRANVHPITE